MNWNQAGDYFLRLVGVVFNANSLPAQAVIDASLTVAATFCDLVASGVAKDIREIKKERHIRRKYITEQLKAETEKAVQEAVNAANRVSMSKADDDIKMAEATKIRAIAQKIIAAAKRDEAEAARIETDRHITIIRAARELKLSIESLMLKGGNIYVSIDPGALAVRESEQQNSAIQGPPSASAEPGS